MLVSRYLVKLTVSPVSLLVLQFSIDQNIDLRSLILSVENLTVKNSLGEKCPTYIQAGISFSALSFLDYD